MGRTFPTLKSAGLLELGRLNVTYTFEEGERIRCDEVFPPNRFKVQIHFEHLPSLHACANLANIRCYASLVGADNLAVSLSDRNGVYRIEAFREVDIDERDTTLHFTEPVVTYVLPEFRDVVKLNGKYKLRFEVVWIRRKRGGFRWEREEGMECVLDTPQVELCYDEKGEEGEPGTIVRPKRR